MLAAKLSENLGRDWIFKDANDNGMLFICKNEMVSGIIVAKITIHSK